MVLQYLLFLLVIGATIYIVYKSEERVKEMALGFLLFRAWLFFFFLPIFINIFSPLVFYLLIPSLVTIVSFVYYKTTGNKIIKYFTILNIFLLFFLLLRALGFPVNFGTPLLWIPFAYIAFQYYKERTHKNPSPKL